MGVGSRFGCRSHHPICCHAALIFVWSRTLPNGKLRLKSNRLIYVKIWEGT
jgi:hypothetical protein